MTMAKYFLCVAVLAVSLRNVKTISPEETAGINEAVRPYVAECSKEFGVEGSQLEKLKESGSADGIDKCFFACVMKKFETIDDKGMFNPEKALEKTKAHLKDEEDIKKAEIAVSECTAVNDEDVNDGEEGCERANLLMACLVKHKVA